MTHRSDDNIALDGTKLEVLAGHYTDTYSVIQGVLKKRDRLFAGILALLFVMLFQLYAPIESSNFIAKLIADKLEISEALNFIYVQSAIWFLLLSACIKYFQAVVHIDRQYGYIHSLEAVISAEFEGGAFTREGSSYLEDYPAFLNWASFLYTILFPLILVSVLAAKIISEFRISGHGEPLVWFNLLMFLSLLVSIGLYLHVVHAKRNRAPTKTENTIPTRHED